MNCTQELTSFSWKMGSAQLVWVVNLVSMLLLVNAAATQESTGLQQCISNFDPNVDYYQKLLPLDVTNRSFVLPIPLDLQEIDTATGFAVNYGNYYKVVDNQFFNLTYILYQLLGQLVNTSLTSSASDYISSSCVLQYIAEGDVKTIPDADVTSTEVVFTSASGFPGNQSNSVSFDATYDGGPLKRAEWIKYLATFLNVEDRAETVFNYVYKSYQCMNGSMNASSTKPTIAWLQYTDGLWLFSNATYKLQFDADAGGVNLGGDTLGMSFNLSLASDLGSFHQLLKQIDVVVDETYAPDPYSYTFDNFTTNAQVDTANSNMSVIMNNRVWRVDKRVGLDGGLDWYESAIPQPHVVLYDLIGILYPSKQWNQTYFRNIALNQQSINSSALVCTYSFGQAQDPLVISDSEVMKCVNSTSSMFSGSLATPLPSSGLYLLTALLLFLIWGPK